MNTTSSKALLAVIGLALAGAGFAAGQFRAKSEEGRKAASHALGSLATDLSVLRFLHKGQMEEAIKIVQGSTSGELSRFIESERFAADLEKCRVLNTLKQYRAKKGLFVGKDWEFLWKMPGMQEEEERRRNYLEGLQCGSEVFFKAEDL
jgi:hypothetical protein